MREEKDEKFEKLLSEALISAQNEEMEKWNSVSSEEEEFSLRHKRSMNRLFRIRLGSRYRPYPEADRLTVWRRAIQSAIRGGTGGKRKRRK